MEINCETCGTANQIGQMFCAGCGRKLSMKAVTNEQKETAQMSARKKSIIKNSILGVVLVIIAIWQAGFWAKGPIGEEGTRKGAESMNVKMAAIEKAIESKVSTDVTFSEKEINGYLADIQDRVAGANILSVRVDLTPGAFVARMHKSRKFAGMNMPKKSIDLVGGASGNMVYAYKGKVGFRWAGRGTVTAAYWPLVETMTDREKEIFKHIKSIEFKDGEFVVSLK